MIHLDESRRDEGWQACLRSYGISAPIPDGWNCFAVIEGSDVIGGVLVNGPEAHIGVNKTANIRTVLRQVIGAQLRQYGYATTSVRKCNAKGQRFVERIGYVREREDESCVYYTLKEMRYA